MIVKEGDVAYFNILCQHFPGITEENDKKLEKLASGLNNILI